MAEQNLTRCFIAPNFLKTQENQKDFLGPENQRFSRKTSLNKEITFPRKVNSKSNNKTRCFIAIDLPRKAINEIIKIQKLIKEKKLFDGKLVEGENLHLTLKFLGEIDKKKIVEVKQRLKEIKFNDFEAGIGKIGVFPSRYNSYIRVLWIELNGKGVFGLQKQIDECLNGLFEKENRFMSHITLARIKRVYDRNGFLDYLKKIKIPKMKFNINRFFLKKSELFPEGPIYEDLGEYSAEKKYN